MIVAVVILGGATGSMGCSSSLRVSFHPSDSTFTPTPGPLPRIYMESNLHEVPTSGIRSVGIIEVTVPASSGTQRTFDVAAKKGQELGCWILVEHSAFMNLASKASSRFGAVVVLVHGDGHAAGGSTGGNASSGGTLTAEFDCVVPASEDA